MLVQRSRALFFATLGLLAAGCKQPEPAKKKNPPAEAVVKPAEPKPVDVPLAMPAPTKEGLPDPGFAVGEPFPAVVLPDLEGHPTSIASYGGKKVILHIFGSW